MQAKKPIYEKKGYLARKYMERIVNIHIEKLPEGIFLATSDSVRGLVAQGRTITETLEIARDVAKKIIDAEEEMQLNFSAPQAKDSFDYPLVVAI